ncbi:MAG: 50S ribosomal protein L30 [Anaerococcus sp.]|uniref:Large ribosomal subunit protein uL30 n=2 Tax=Anaerococcus hydrogenalis TaxID=33029 RepID=F0H1V8_9FIRM|nr:MULTISPECIES: 50S ribosomal protein L30 [Anaerococcus]EGC83447.1 ribosomal protein L30 [Anaerococcus hydrogenalis ACS-025-V-Sch4]MBS4889009.1 50S ribosomal protein L30 [Anaerococcus vaginalis]MDD7766610.1 50S ribosomal protein L30 [Anaerococcus vaginalis]MDK7694794.1 50S ribosomal protein L30 [Anaerococcus hydrogenalis]MDK7696652.1 50S ribosomal protein L30 [Anaerococcus hydrogenalis]
MAKVEIKLKKSFIGRKDDQIATAKALGLKKIGQTVVREDNSALRGMINKIPFMLEVKELS